MHRLPPDQQPGGIHALMKGYERRVPATYLLGRDKSTWFLPRWLARALSGYERAWIVELLHEIVPPAILVECTLVWLFRRVTFVLAGRSRGDNDEKLNSVEVPGSGLSGSILAITVWGVFALGIMWLLFFG